MNDKVQSQVNTDYNRGGRDKGAATNKERIDQGQERAYRNKATYYKRIRSDNVHNNSVKQVGRLPVAYNAKDSDTGIATKHTAVRQSMTCNTDISDNSCASLSTPGAYYSSCK